MSGSRPRDDEQPAPGPEKEKETPEKDERPKPRDRNGELDEGLDETFPASDPPAPSRPTGET